MVAWCLPGWISAMRDPTPRLKFAPADADSR
jgi:hypothetical protein